MPSYVTGKQEDHIVEVCTCGQFLHERDKTDTERMIAFWCFSLHPFAGSKVTNERGKCHFQISFNEHQCARNLTTTCVCFCEDQSDVHFFSVHQNVSFFSWHFFIAQCATHTSHFHEHLGSFVDVPMSFKQMQCVF